MNKRFMVYRKGFSLVEVMVTLLIFSVVMIAIAPVITKKLSIRSKDGIVYTYKQNNTQKINSKDVCFATEMDGSGNEQLTVNGANCNQYVFTVPTGVHHVNLTMVAGGGGGGGASGGKHQEFTVDTSENDNKISRKNLCFTSDNGYKFIPDLLKWVRINYMVIAGESGGAINTNCSNSFSKCGGKGGNIRWGIVNFTLPQYMTRGANYTNDLDYTGVNAKSGLLRLSSNNICDDTRTKPEKLECQASVGIYYGVNLASGCEAADTTHIEQKISYQVSDRYRDSQPANTRFLGCYFSGQNQYVLNPDGSIKLNPDGSYVKKAGIPNDYAWGTSYFPLCGLKEENMIDPSKVNSSYGVALGSDVGTFPNNFVLAGGQGAKVPGVPFGYGNGARGASGIVSCSTSGYGCKSSSITSSNISTANHVADLEYKDNTYPKYKNVAINKISGKAGVSISYAIEYPAVTGGGGSAGSVARIMSLSVTPGEKYYILVGRGGIGGFQGLTASAPTSGTNGGGGSSTAIFDKDGNLIYLVTGGVGGNGGIFNRNINDANHGKSMSIAQSARSTAKLLYNSKLINDVALDSNMLNVISSESKNYGISDAKTLNLKYPVYYQEPYLTFRKGLSSPYTIDDKSAGFSGYRSTIKKLNNFSVPGKTVTTYDGLYFRTLVGNDSAYVGGLGGHSGLGGKAGCGGYFMGNFDGRIYRPDKKVIDGVMTDIILTESLRYLTNKFIINNTAYDTFSYYSNCNNKSPDGSTAEFVAPNPVASTFGQAGAGGGGGGWSTTDSSGKGGDGQDGYVMIEWQK